MLRRLALTVVVLAVLLVLGLAVAARLGWATPLGMPSSLHFHGRNYGGGGCVRNLRADELPLRKVGSVFGYLTGSKPILIPHYESRLLTPKGIWTLTPAVLYVRGDCLASYDLSGGP